MTRVSGAVMSGAVMSGAVMSGTRHRTIGRGVCRAMKTFGRPALALVAFLVAACSVIPGASTSPSDETLKTLAEHQAQWQAKAVDDYAFTIARQCFCPSNDPIDITVVDGVIASAQKGGQPVQQADLAGLPTSIGDLFAIVAAEAVTAASIAVEWDPVFGFPASIQIDHVANAIDDEIGYTVTNFRPAS